MAGHGGSAGRTMFGTMAHPGVMGWHRIFFETELEPSEVQFPLLSDLCCTVIVGNGARGGGVALTRAAVEGGFVPRFLHPRLLFYALTTRQCQTVGTLLRHWQTPKLKLSDVLGSFCIKGIDSICKPFPGYDSIEEAMFYPNVILYYFVSFAIEAAESAAASSSSSSAATSAATVSNWKLRSLDLSGYPLGMSAYEHIRKLAASSPVAGLNFHLKVDFVSNQATKKILTSDVLSPQNGPLHLEINNLIVDSSFRSMDKELRDLANVPQVSGLHLPLYIEPSTEFISTHSSSLVTLSLVEAFCTNKEAMFKRLCDVISRLTSLTHLDLSGNRAVDMAPIFARISSPLRRLRLSDCALKEADLCAICEAAFVGGLQNLDLSENRLRVSIGFGCGLLMTLMKLLRKCRLGLKQLNLSSCAMPDASLLQLGLTLKDATGLQNLDLRDNDSFTVETILSTAPSLLRIGSLRLLQLSYPSDMYDNDLLAQGISVSAEEDHYFRSRFHACDMSNRHTVLYLCDIWDMGRHSAFDFDEFVN